MDTNLCRCQEGEQEKTEERIKVHLDECETSRVVITVKAE